MLTAHWPLIALTSTSHSTSIPITMQWHAVVFALVCCLALLTLARAHDEVVAGDPTHVDESHLFSCSRMPVDPLRRTERESFTCIDSSTDEIIAPLVVPMLQPSESFYGSPHLIRSNYTAKYHTHEEAAAADPFPLPVITPLGPLRVVEDKEVLKQKYAPPELKGPVKSLRTSKPKYAPQPSPYGNPIITYNTSNSHQIPPNSINLQYISNFITQEEAKHFRRLSEHLELYSQPSTSLSQSGRSEVDLAYRQSTSTYLPKDYDRVTERLEWRVARLLNVPKEKVRPVQIVRYSPADFFQPHFDGNEVAPLRFTIFVYLNDIPFGEGGETVSGERQAPA
jgi:hypothetical protein